QAGVKPLYGSPEAGLSLRKEGDQPALRKRAGDIFPGLAHGGALAALDIDGARQCREPADDGPAAYLRLAEESRRKDGIHDKDVEPRNVVERERAPVRQRGN